MKRPPALRALALAFLLGPGSLGSAFLLGPGALLAQDSQDRSVVTLAPILGPTWSGHRYELEGSSVTDSRGDPVEVTLGPTTGLELGLAAEIRPWERFGLVFSGSWTALDFLQVRTSPNEPDNRNISGDQSLVRFTGGVRYRVVPRAPGYFSAGVLVNRFIVDDSGPVVAAPDRTELGGFGGLGLDFGGSDRHLRAEGRLMLVAPDAEPLDPRGFSGTHEPRSMVLDYSLTLAFVFGI